MRKQNILIMVLLTILNLNLNLNLKSQVAVNTSGNAADASAMLDVSSTDKGILIPRMTLAKRDLIDSPVPGLLIYQTDNTPGFYFYDGSAWVVVGDGATSINSLYDGKTGGHSVFLGNNSGTVDDGSDNWNTGIGEGVLPVNTAGSYNTVVGDRGMQSNETGWNNTAIGHKALYSNVLGIGNIAIGFEAGYNETGSNKLYIDNSNTDNPLIYGDFSTNLLRVNGTLDINNAYQLPTTDGTNDQTLKTDGSGSLTWSDDGGATSINDLSDAATDNNSLFLGFDAGTTNANSFNFNTGIGVWSLKDVTSGSHNSALGTTALQQLTTGSQNTAFGMGALSSVTTNSNNTAIGKEAGKDVTGTGNIFIGNEAAKTQTSINNKLFIDNSDTVAPLIYGDFENNIVRINHKLEITSDSTGSSFKLYEPDTAGVHYTMFKTQHQDTNIVYYLPYQLPQVGQVIKYDVSGNLNWFDDGGASNINGLSDGKTGGYSVFLGTDAGAKDDGSYNRNTAIGHKALYENTTGSYNTGTGADALYENTTGSYNTGTGAGALYENTTGNYNTGIGRYALSVNQTGSYNVAIGYKAGINFNYTDKSGCVFIGYKAGYGNTASNKLYIENSSSTTPLIYGEFDNDLVRINGDLEVTGSSNINIGIDNLSDGRSSNDDVFLGYKAGQNNTGNNYSTAVGVYALHNNTSGDNNSALGRDALHQNTDGNNNTAIGSEAMLNNTTGGDNTAIGRSSLNSNTTAGSNTAIGAYSLEDNTTGHHNTALGKSALVVNTTGNENTAIGADALKNGTTGYGNSAIGENSLNNTTSGHHNTAVGRFALDSNTDGNENTAIGAYAGPTGSWTHSNTGTFGYDSHATASNYYRFGNGNVLSIGGKVGWSAWSDSRFKQNVKEDVPGLDFILKLKPVSYNWDIQKLNTFIGSTKSNEQNEADRKRQESIVYTGFLAQEVEKAANEVGYDFSGVETPPNDGTPYSLRYAEFVVPLVKAVQELAGQNEEQQEIIDLLKQQNEMLMKRLDKLERK